MSTLNPLTVVPDEGCSPHLLNCHPVILGPVDFSRGFPGGSVVKNLPANEGDVGWIPGSGRAPGEGNGDPLQDSCLGNLMDRRAWWVTVHGFAEPDTTEQLSSSSSSGV